MKKISIWIIVVIVILLAIFFASFAGNKEKVKKDSGRPAQQIKVNAYIIRPSLLVNEISVSGSLKAFEEVDLKNEIPGRVVELNLPEGKHVRKGALLVKLYDDDLQATLKKLQAQLDVQQKIYERQTELRKVNGISENDYEQTYLTVNTLKAEIEEQKAQIRKTEVLAPFDGTIGLRNISLGAFVASSTLLATIRAEENLKLDFFVPEKYGAAVRQGMKIKFTMTDDKTEYDATVMASEEGVDASTRNIKVRAIVNSKSPDLIPGAFAGVNLRLNENPQAIVIPTKAIIPQEENKSVIIAKKGRAHFTNVNTGIRKASGIEITEGLQPGDTVITSGVLFLKEGSKLSYASVIDSL